MDNTDIDADTGTATDTDMDNRTIHRDGSGYGLRTTSMGTVTVPPMIKCI
jgi:hypothetical protein